MVRGGKVRHLHNSRSKNVVRVFIKKDSLAKYKKELSKKNTPINEDGPHFQFSIAKPEIFADDLRDFYSKHPGLKEVEKKYDTEGDWLQPVISFLLPLVIIVLVWVLLMRKMGSGGGGSG